MDTKTMPQSIESGSDAWERRGALQRPMVPPKVPSLIIQQPIPKSTDADSQVCPRCQGAGYTRHDVPYGHPNFGRIEKCACKLAAEREKRKQDLLRLSQLGGLTEKTFASFDWLVPGVQEAYTVAWEYAHCPDGWLVLIGTHGCGKTHLAAAAANLLLEGDQPVLFTTVPDLLDHLRATYAPTSEVTYDALYTLMCEAGVLVLDDLGAQHTTPWAEEKLFQLINRRYVWRSPTIITTNHIRLSGVNERIRSRLSDVDFVRSVTFGPAAGDYRPQKRR
jgi:DNA replication protein DnaC